MNKFIEKHKTKLIILLCALVSGIVSVSATVIIFSSSEVSYDNSESGMSSSNVQDAIDELYGVARFSERLEKVEKTLDNYLEKVYPVGSIYISADDKNPEELFGGTWVTYGSGKTLVGVDSSDDDFKIVEKTGGEKTHTLTIDEMPSHAHYLPRGSYSGSGYNASGNPILRSSGSIGGGTPPADTLTSYLGNSSAHNNLQPYITVYMWKRTK